MQPMVSNRLGVKPKLSFEHSTRVYGSKTLRLLYSSYLVQLRLSVIGIAQLQATRLKLRCIFLSYPKVHVDSYKNQCQPGFSQQGPLSIFTACNHLLIRS